MFDFQQPDFLHHFESKYKQKGAFFIIPNKMKTEDFYEQLFFSLKKSKKLDNYTLIHLEKPFLPFLNMEDNIFIEVPKQSLSKESVSELLTLFQLPYSLLEQNPLTLNSFESLKFQLIHALLLQKECILLPDIAKVCSTAELQALLAILEHAAKKYGVTILLLTDDDAILKSSYFKKADDL